MQTTVTLAYSDFSAEKFHGLKVAADWIRDLERSDSRLHKEGVISKALTAARLGSTSAQCFLYNCYQAYNPYYVFNMRKVSETKNLVGRDNPWPKFWALLESLRTHSVTGNRARDRVNEVAQLFDSEEWNSVCRRVLIKDLRCGISEKTLNKILGKTEWQIPVFTCQLAQDSTDQPHKLTGSKRLEVKLDGVRVLAVVHNDSVNLFSRNGKTLENFPQIVQQITDCKDAFLHRHNLFSNQSYVLDGEIVGESFQTLMRQAHRKSGAQTENMIFHIFDICALADFKQGVWRTAQSDRLEILESIRDLLPEKWNLRVMPGMTVNLDTAQGHDIMQRFAEASVKQGYEGIMIKNLDAPYQCKRTTNWLKWKPTISVDLTIVGFEEGTGRNQGRLGAIIYEGVDNGRNIRVNVGTGFSDSQRDEYWQHRTKLLGIIGEVQADAVTQNQDGSYSLRFPRHLRFRGFEPGEKL